MLDPLSTSVHRNQCPNEKQNSGCSTDNQVAISGCLSKLLVICDLPLIETTFVSNKSGLSVCN